MTQQTSKYGARNGDRRQPHRLLAGYAVTMLALMTDGLVTGSHPGGNLGAERWNQTQRN